MGEIYIRQRSNLTNRCKIALSYLNHDEEEIYPRPEGRATGRNRRFQGTRQHHTASDQRLQPPGDAIGCGSPQDGKESLGRPLVSQNSGVLLSEA